TESMVHKGMGNIDGGFEGNNVLVYITRPLLPSPANGKDRSHFRQYRPRASNGFLRIQRQLSTLVRRHSSPFRSFGLDSVAAGVLAGRKKEHHWLYDWEQLRETELDSQMVLTNAVHCRNNSLRILH